jgi:hypothetical protein
MDPRKTRRLGSVSELEQLEQTSLTAAPIPSDYPPPQEDPQADEMAEVGIETVVVPERPRARSARWRAFEVWTRNRVYGLDANLQCFVVLDRKTRSVDKNPNLKGYKLGGGRLKLGPVTKIAYPFPLVGMEAMFTDGKRTVHTSKTERFVIRIRELSFRGEEESSSWEDVVSGS